MATFEASRPGVGAMAVGTAYEVALDYARQRRQFGRPIIENQAVAFTLADMKTRIDAARLLVWRAAWMARNGEPFESAAPLTRPGQRSRWVGPECPGGRYAGEARVERVRHGRWSA